MNKTQLLIRDLVLLLFAILVTSLLGCQDDAPDSALMAPSTESTGATNVGRTSITVAGRYLGNLDKITRKYGVKYSTSNNFPSDATSYVRFTGSPTSIVSTVLEGLSANTHYYYSWYATTGATEVSSSYGEFTTTATSKAPVQRAECGLGGRELRPHPLPRIGCGRRLPGGGRHRLPYQDIQFLGTLHPSGGGRGGCKQ